jgi:hypothetical protein
MGPICGGVGVWVVLRAAVCQHDAHAMGQTQAPAVGGTVKPAGVGPAAADSALTRQLLI